MPGAGTISIGAVGVAEGITAGTAIGIFIDQAISAGLALFGTAASSMSSSMSESADENQKKADGLRNDSDKGGNSSIPDKAKQIANYVKNNNGTPPKGYKGGRTYKNIPLEDGAQKLPEGVNYREYDVNPYVKGQNRGAERIVIGDDGSVWYTNDHYFTFTQIE